MTSGEFIFIAKNLKMSKDHTQNKVRTLRFFSAKVTQQQLADEVGDTRQTLTTANSDKYFPTLELSFIITKVFNATLDEVFTYGLSKDNYKR